MVALLPLAMELQPAFAGLFRARNANDVAEVASMLSGAVLRGERFTAFTSDDPETREHVLGMLAELLAEHAVNVELREPAEIYQLVDGLDRTEQAGVLAIWASPANDSNPHARRPLFVIENAETLPSQTIEFLWLAATVFLTGPPAPQILFLGETRFQDMLRSHECRGIREHITTNLTVASNSQPAERPWERPPLETGRLQAPQPYQAATARAQVRWIIAGIIILFGLGAAAKLSGLTSPGPTQAIAPVAAPPQETSGAPSPLPVGPAAPSPIEASLQPPIPSAPPLPPPPKPDVPVQMPQAQQSTAQAAAPQAEDGRAKRVAEAAVRPLGQRPVVVLFRAGSAKSEEQARQIAASLAGRVAAAEIRPESNLPRVPRIRYFGREDKSPARDLNGILNSSTDRLWIRHQAVRPPDVQPGTIEIQLPLQPRANHPASRPSHHQQ